MTVDLFAGISVGDYRAALAWYENLLGAPPSFFPNDVEAVWQVGEHRFVYIEQVPEHAGHAQLLLFVEDLDDRLAAISARGIEPVKQETYDNGVRKVTYYDADGNEFAFGASPTERHHSR